ncbi:MAG: hypothetical protein ABJD97_07440 [Betaproteobacteria bacterium]
MANIKRIPPEPPVPSVPGGAARASRLVDLAAYPAVSRRQAVNERLLSGICGHDTHGHGTSWTEADAPILAGIARERVGGDQVLLRRQAFAALAQARTLPALESLAAIALSPLEDPAARGRALSAFESVSPLLGRALAEVLRSDTDLPLATCARKIVATPGALSRPRKRRAPGKDRG